MREIIKNKTVDVVNQNDDYVHHVKNMSAIQSLYKISACKIPNEVL